MFIIFLAEIAGGILAYIFRAQANELVIDSLRNTIEQHYNKSGNLAETVTRAVDSIQQEVLLSWYFLSENSFHVCLTAHICFSLIAVELVRM